MLSCLRLVLWSRVTYEKVLLSPFVTYYWISSSLCSKAKTVKFSPEYSPPHYAVPIVIGASILGLVIIMLLLICWVCSCCYLYKRFRNPGRKSMFVRQNGRKFLEYNFRVASRLILHTAVTTTTTVVTRHPQPSAVIQGGQYLSYQALPNPPCGGQPVPTGPPPSYQEAGKICKQDDHDYLSQDEPSKLLQL